MRGLSVLVSIVVALIGSAMLLKFHAHAHSKTARVADEDPRSTLTIAQGVDMESMEPDNLNSASSVNIADLLWVRLLQVTPEGKLVPYLASGYTWNAAGTEITFTIRPGQVCEDGAPITARDVVYTFQRAADPRLGFYGNLPAFVYNSIGFVGARQDAEFKATILVKGYSSQTPGMLSMAHILCADSYAKISPEAAATKPIASGPYKLAEWVRDDRLVLVRNDRYALGRSPFERVVFRVIPEASTRAAELIAGGVDLITNVSPDQKNVIDMSGTATVKAVEGTRRMFVGFSFAPSFAATPGGMAIQNKAVRQALEYAVDVPTLCAQLLQMPCKRMTGPANLVQQDIAPYPFDPEKAEALLDTAGYRRGADGVRFHLTLEGPSGRYLEDTNVAQAVGQYLDDVGVATKVEAMDFNSVFSPRSRHHQVGPLYFLGQGGATWSALFGISIFPSKMSPMNTGEWYDPAWQIEFDRLKNVRDPVEERAILDRMLAIFRDDAPWIFLYFQPDFYGIGRRIDWEPRHDELIDVMAIRPRG